MDNDRFQAIKAYNNPSFLQSRDARVLRMLAEYLEPAARFEHFKVRDTVVFMGSARIRSRQQAEAEITAAKAGHGDLKAAERDLKLSRYYEDTRELARRLTVWSKTLAKRERRYVVCTGGGPGIMEAANRGASEAKGVNLGFNIALPHEQAGNAFITHQLGFEFHYFFMRKFWFAYLAKAVVIMPGGFGTLDEMFELLTLIQTRKVTKPMPLILFGSDYWDKVLNIDALIEFGTISPEDTNLLYRTDSVDEAFAYLTAELDRAGHEDGGPDL